MSKKNISVKLDTKLLETIESYAKSRRMTRTSAIVSMLTNVRVVVISEGEELIKALYCLERLLKTYELDYDVKKEVERVCKNIWHLLGLITEKIQSQTDQ